MIVYVGLKLTEARGLLLCGRIYKLVAVYLVAYIINLDNRTPTYTYTFFRVSIMWYW